MRVSERGEAYAGRFPRPPPNPSGRIGGPDCVRCIYGRSDFGRGSGSAGFVPITQQPDGDDPRNAEFFPVSYTTCNKRPRRRLPATVVAFDARRTHRLASHAAHRPRPAVRRENPPLQPALARLPGLPPHVHQMHARGGPPALPRSNVSVTRHPMPSSGPSATVRHRANEHMALNAPSNAPFRAGFGCRDSVACVGCTRACRKQHPMRQ